MAFWTKLFRALTSLAPRFKREYGDEAANDYTQLVSNEAQRKGRAASARLALRGTCDALRVAVRERLAETSLVPRSVGPDVRQALRIYRREPVLALAVALTLALGVGTTTAAYSAVHDILLRDLPFRDEDRLVVLYSTTERTQGMYGSYADVQDFSAQMRATEWLGGARGSGATWTASDEARNLNVVRVTDRFLTALGVRFAAGRDFVEREQTAAVASRAFAERYFGSVDAAIGRHLDLDDGDAEIVGVLDETVEIPYRGAPELFRPYAVSPTEIAARGSNAVMIIARLRSGVSIEEADAEAKLVQQRLAATYPKERDNGVRLTPLRAEITGEIEQPLWGIFAAVVLVLAIALASVVSLLLSRSAARAGEVAVRVSLGASRGRLARLWLFESLALAIPGGAAGLALAYALVAVARSLLPPGSGRINTMQVEGAALTAAIGLILLSAAAFNLAPRLLGLGRMKLAAVKDASRGVAGLRRARWQSALITGQVALAIVLVCCAVWLAASLARLQATPLGFKPDGVMTAQFSLTRDLRMSMAARIALMQRLLEEARGIPGVADAAISSGLPGGRTSRFGPSRIRPGDPPFERFADESVVRFTVSPSFFPVLGISPIRGRTFTEADRAAPDRSVIVSESFVAKYLRDGDVGTFVALSGRNPQEVIGVVPDVHADALGRESDPQFYVVDTSGGLLGALSLKARPGATIRAEDVKSLFHRVSPDMAVIVRPMRDMIGVALESREIVTRAAYGFAAIALLLAAINVYGLAALTVVQRTREIGIRMALGAAGHDAVGIVVLRGARWIGAGMLIGLGAAILVAAPAIRSQLFQTDTSEPLLVSIATVLVCAIALIALWIPARRAAAIDPAITLRAE